MMEENPAQDEGRRPRNHGTRLPADTAGAGVALQVPLGHGTALTEQ